MKLPSSVIRLHQGESAATNVEYAIMLALIALVAIVAINTVGDAANEMATTASEAIGKALN